MTHFIKLSDCHGVLTNNSCLFVSNLKFRFGLLRTRKLKLDGTAATWQNPIGKTWWDIEDDTKELLEKTRLETQLGLQLWSCVSWKVWRLESLNDWNVWKFESLKVWKFESLKVWKCESVKVWKFESLKFGKLESWKVGKFKSLKVWLLESLV